MLPFHGFQILIYAYNCNNRYINSHETIEHRRDKKNVPKLNSLFKRNRFRLTAILGVLLLILGVSLLGYSISAIQEREHMLTSTELTLEELWHYEGSLSWWRNAYVTLFLQLTAVFMALGGIVLFSQPLLTMLHRKSVLDNFSENVKRASDENYERPKLD